MKKSISLILCLLLLFGLAACGNSEQDAIFDELTKSSSSMSSEASQAEESASSQPESHKEVDDTAVSSKTPIVYDQTIQYVEWGDLFNLEPNTELSGTLKIRAFMRAPIEPWVEEFMAAYPNVNVELDVRSIVDDKASQELALALNTGTAGDIIMTGLLSNIKYAESGLLLDLYPFMEADPDFHTEDYYTNVFKGLETRDGKLCVMSPSFTTPCALFNSKIMDAMGVDLLKEYPDGITYKDVVDLYHRAVEEGHLKEGTPLSPLGSKDYLSQIMIPDYLDEANHTSDFENPGFVEYLETMMSIPAGTELNWDGYVFDYEFTGKSEFMVQGSLSLELLREYREGNPKMNSSVLVPFKTEGGKRLFETTCPMGITSACENPKLAWEFIKFMISEKPFPAGLDENGEQEPAYRKIYRDGAPINRNNYQNLCRALYEDEDELIQYVNDVLENCDRERFRNSELAAAWSEIKKDYFQYELISAEECAKQLQERTWIYMNE